jgi:hypothetical protein
MRMLMSEQFTQSNALSTLLEDLRSVATIGARHGTSEQAGDWVVSIGTAPTVQQQWMQLDPIIQTRPRQVVVSVTERIRHGPDKGTTDVGMPFLDSGFQVSDDLLQRLQHAIAFFARWRSDPGRGDAHEAWAAGSHRMAVADAQTHKPRALARMRQRMRSGCKRSWLLRLQWESGCT